MCLSVWAEVSETCPNKHAPHTEPTEVGAAAHTQKGIGYKIGKLFSHKKGWPFVRFLRQLQHCCANRAPMCVWVSERKGSEREADERTFTINIRKLHWFKCELHVCAFLRGPWVDQSPWHPRQRPTEGASCQIYDQRSASALLLALCGVCHSKLAFSQRQRSTTRLCSSKIIAVTTGCKDEKVQRGVQKEWLLLVLEMKGKWSFISIFSK